MIKPNWNDHELEHNNLIFKLTCCFICVRDQ